MTTKMTTPELLAHIRAHGATETEVDLSERLSAAIEEIDRLVAELHGVMKEQLDGPDPRG
jgi:hypothetical protein